MEFITLKRENLEQEHICCAIADKKHQAGVEAKKAWLKDRLADGHTFTKLDARGKVFIEYTPLENAWVPVVGENFLYIHCLWVSGSFKGKGYAKELLASCIADAKQQGRSGVCVISAKKKKPFLSDKAFMLKHGFEPADSIGEYELLAISFDGTKPQFTESARKQTIDSETLTIYYGLQCPYIPNCISEVQAYCKKEGIPLNLIHVDTLKKAKAMPCVFNNWAVFYQGKFETVHLLNEGYLKKMLGK
ncbi:MAG: GNAT family N-acetyltransferase [Spirochaetia bacterium]|nr:GNAT family N-acetyltransferase [Spirochaetia bacterium]